jgi:hypothetical protein
LQENIAINPEQAQKEIVNYLLENAGLRFFRDIVEQTINESEI